ncbi:flagellar biosynthetic protein FliR [Malikia granosa]|uniref:Flagellar biosynthetic protein FliR n=1 Tax=Malikia granosa TaxID=263067 RepID=A0A2S9K4D3_9BURK|nr:flagellar biosynthetic protein FliR [Malikia granosa]PRD65311.1 flagellar biosynthetic protein FliR [Malikia granosa]
MVEFTTEQLFGWVSAFLWPLTRILGVIASAPLLSHKSIPIRVKLGLGLLLAMIVAPTLPPFPEQDPLSWAGLLILAQQMLIGLALGFMLRIIFTGVELAGEMIGMTMGLGFATFFDPGSQGRSSVISQFLSLLLLLVFIGSDLHLLLLEALVESFTLLPVTTEPVQRGGLQQIAYWGARIFGLGLQLAMPAITALLITNMALGVLTRAAPQLNLFGIGFPITMTVGFVMIMLSLPYWSQPMLDALREGLAMVRQITLALSPA